MIDANFSIPGINWNLHDHSWASQNAITKWCCSVKSTKSITVLTYCCRLLLLQPSLSWTLSPDPLIPPEDQLYISILLLVVGFSIHLRKLNDENNTNPPLFTRINYLLSLVQFLNGKSHDSKQIDLTNLKIKINKGFLLIGLYCIFVEL